MKVGYCRVSTGEQEDALIQQVSRIEKAGAVKIYKDIESGKSDKRKNFNLLLNDVRNGLITEIVITRMDRLARSMLTTLKNMKLFEDYKVKLTILDAPIDIDSPFGWYSMSQMAGLAEFELRLIQARIKHGYDYFHAENKASSRPPFGFARVNERYAFDNTINELSGKANWLIARDIVDYFLKENSTLRSTINYVFLTYKIDWSPPGLRYWLNNPVLQGDTCYNIMANRCSPENWDIRPNTHPPLITREEAKLIKLQLENNKRKWGQNTGTKVASWPLSGKIICGDCGYKCFLYSRRSTMPIRCRKRNHFGEAYCSNKTVTHLQKIIQAVDNQLITRAKDLSNYIVNNKSEDTINPELIELKQQLDSLNKLPQNEVISQAIKSTILRIEDIQAKTSLNKKINSEYVNLFIKYFSNKDYWEELPIELKTDLYKQFVDKVVVLNGNVLSVTLIDIII